LWKGRVAARVLVRWGAESTGGGARAREAAEIQFSERTAAFLSLGESASESGGYGRKQTRK
jgi:hypothetical protein